MSYATTIEMGAAYLREFPERAVADTLRRQARWVDLVRNEFGITGPVSVTCAVVPARSADTVAFRLELTPSQEATTA